MIVVHEWIKDVDGLIPAAAQRYGRHPSALAITAVEEIGMNDNIPLDGCNLGALIRIARGYYLDCETWNQLSARERFLMVIQALVPRASSAIITGEAAAVMHGIPVLLRNCPIALARTSRRSRTSRRGGLSNLDGGKGRSFASIQRVNQQILPADIVTVRGRLVTDVPKTVIDVCRSKVSENGLAVADAALRSYCSMDELTAILRDYPRSPGNKRARDILAIANERTESIGESLTKNCIIKAGIAGGSGAGGSGAGVGGVAGVGGIAGAKHECPPELLQQVEFRDGSQFVGRVDFFIPDLNLVIEFDGVTKYAANSVKATERVLVREREREKRLRNMGLEVHRLVWKDVINEACVDSLRTVAWECVRRVRAGGRTFSLEMGNWREAQLTFEEWTLRQRRIDERQARRNRLATND